MQELYSSCFKITRVGTSSDQILHNCSSGVVAEISNLFMCFDELTLVLLPDIPKEYFNLQKLVEFGYVITDTVIPSFFLELFL